MTRSYHAIGIDATDINRFTHWHAYSPKTLQRFFSQPEIDYCLSVPVKRAERFAIRFAAREAFYKALAQLNHQKKIPPLLTIARNTIVVRDSKHGPSIQINWEHLNVKPVNTSRSITHTHTTAIACVLLTQVQCTGD